MCDGLSSERLYLFACRNSELPGVTSCAIKHYAESGDYKKVLGLFELIRSSTEFSDELLHDVLLLLCDYPYDGKITLILRAFREHGYIISSHTYRVLLARNNAELDFESSGPYFEVLACVERDWTPEDGWIDLGYKVQEEALELAIRTHNLDMVRQLTSEPTSINALHVYECMLDVKIRRSICEDCKKIYKHLYTLWPKFSEEQRSLLDLHKKSMYKKYTNEVKRMKKQMAKLEAVSVSV